MFCIIVYMRSKRGVALCAFHEPSNGKINGRYGCYCGWTFTRSETLILNKDYYVLTTFLWPSSGRMWNCSPCLQLKFLIWCKFDKVQLLSTWVHQNHELAQRNGCYCVDVTNILHWTDFSLASNNYFRIFSSITLNWLW